MQSIKISKALFVLAAVFCLTISVHANSASTRNVVDNANVLSETEIFLLQNSIDTMIAKYNADFVILTENGIDKTPEAYADDYYDYNGYGYDEQFTGVLLLVDFGERKIYISTCGAAINLLTDSEQQGIIEAMRPELQSQEDYYNAFNGFLITCDINFVGHNSAGVTYTYAEGDNDYDYSSYYDGDYDDYGFYLSDYETKLFLGGFAGGLFVSTIVVFIIYRRYKRAKSQVTSQYLDAGSVNIHVREDRFVSTHTSVTALPKNNDSGGGSSTHTSSSGRTHGGSGGDF